MVQRVLFAGSMLRAGRPTEGAARHSSSRECTASEISKFTVRCDQMDRGTALHPATCEGAHSLCVLQSEGSLEMSFFRSEHLQTAQ